MHTETYTLKRTCQSFPLMLTTATVPTRSIKAQIHRKCVKCWKGSHFIWSLWYIEYTYILSRLREILVTHQVVCSLSSSTGLVAWQLNSPEESAVLALCAGCQLDANKLPLCCCCIIAADVAIVVCVVPRTEPHYSHGSCCYCGLGDRPLLPRSCPAALLCSSSLWSVSVLLLIRLLSVCVWEGDGEEVKN